MNSNLQAPGSDWHDPIVQELHELRQKLQEQYQGNLHAYSSAARAHALALGFKLTAVQALPPASK